MPDYRRAHVPVEIGADEWAYFVTRNQIIRRWQRTCLNLLAASIDGEISSSIAASLLDHLPLHCGWEHHRRLLRAVDTPVFFRTDQAAGGTVLEVQCPGSLWGVHEILHEFYVEAGSPEATTVPSLSAGFVRSLRNRVGSEPVVHHLLDNSSDPAGERFFIQRARRGAAYFGFDAVRPQDCNFVRSHDFFCLLVDNFASQRLQRVKEGKPVYDLPPVSLFDQKLLLAYPFWDPTRDYFDDEVRSLFPYSTVLTPGGLRIAESDWLTLEEFANLPRNSRNYFLKYAGADVARNWGSRAVYHLGKLSRAACEAKLKEMIEPYAAGERWIVQQEVPSREDVSFVTREGEVETSTGHSKHSIFLWSRWTAGST